jgi:hypothetical protein
MDRVVDTVSGRLAEVSLDLRYGDLRPGKGELPAPTRLIWAGLDLALDDAELSIDHGSLCLKLFDGGGMGPVEVWQRTRVLNEPARLLLVDGTGISADLAHVEGCGTTQRRDGSERGAARMSLESWAWLPDDKAQLVFVGDFEHLRRPPGDNLLLRSGTTWSRGHLRLQGNLTWHLIRRSNVHQAVASFGEIGPSAKALRLDLAALDFVAGESLDLPLMWAIDEQGATVGAIGPGRPRPITHRHRVPVPEGHLVNECWVAPLFRAVTKCMQADDAPIFTAVTGYLDALRGHIHGGYLLAQVALEAFCRATLPENVSAPLVQSVPDWQKWIDDHAKELEAFGASPEDRALLLRKLRDNVFQRPTGEVVERAFLEWGIALPKAIIKEIGKRNSVAHTFTMFDEVEGDLQEAADRVDMVQMLIAGAIAKHADYRGPIVGWQRNDMGALVVPEFWASTDAEEAFERFECRR